MDNRSVAAWLVLLPIVIGLSPGEARAQPTTTATPSAEPRSPAEQHFFAGRALYEGGKISEALVEFRASFSATPSPNSRLYIARCLRDLGDVAAAYEQYAQVIVDAADRTQSARYAPTQKAATEERAALRDKVATVTLIMPNDAPGASAEIAGARVEPSRWGTEITVSAGRTAVHATAPGRQPFDIAVDLGPAETRRITVDLPVASPPPTPSATKDSPLPEAKPEPQHSIPLRPLAYASAGVSVAGFVTWAVMGLSAKSRYSELEAECNGRCPSSLQSRVDGGRTESTLAAVGLAVGLTGLAGGGVLWYLDKRTPTSQAPEKVVSIRIAPTPLGAVLTGAFQ